MKLRIGYNKDSIFSICIAVYYALAVLNRVSSTLFQDSASLKLLSRYGTYMVIIVILLEMIKRKHNLLVFLILELTTAVLFIISNIFGDMGDLDWISVYKLIATTYIPLSIAAYNIVDRKKLLKALHIVSLISVPVLPLVAVLSYGNWDSSYDMSLGYVMVFSVLVLLADYAVDSGVYNIILAGLLSLFILFVGSRGPFICILAFVIIQLLLSNQYSKRKKAAMISAIVILLILVVMNINRILMIVYQTSVKLGFDSRSIYLLMQGEVVSHDSGRNVLLEHYTKLINENPVFGYGVMGKWISDGMYPHNIILEFLLAFGYPLGCILLAILLLIMVKAVRIDKKYDSAVAILFVSYSMHLFVSGSYLKVWQFFVGVALCIPNGIRLRNSLMKHKSRNHDFRGRP